MFFLLFLFLDDWVILGDVEEAQRQGDWLAWPLPAPSSLSSLPEGSGPAAPLLWAPPPSHAPPGPTGTHSRPGDLRLPSALSFNSFSICTRLSPELMRLKLLLEL